MRPPKYSHYQYSRTRLMGNVRFSPTDSSVVYYIDNTRGVFDIWKQNLPGSYPVEMTHSKEFTPRGFAITNDGTKILITADYQGNELMQIFSLPTTGGNPKLLSKNREKRYSPCQNGMLPNNKEMVISTDSLGTTMDIAIMDIETGVLQQITASDTNFFAASVSPDFKYIAAIELFSNTKQKLHLIDFETKEIRLLTDHDEDITYSIEGWDSESKGFYLTTNSGRDFTHGAYMDITTAEIKFIIEPDWDVDQIRASKDGKWLTWTVNEEGYTRLHLKNLQTGEEVDPSIFPQGLVTIQSISDDSRYMAFNFMDSGKVSDAHVLDLDTFEQVILTKNMLGGIDPNDMVYPELVKLTSLEDDNLEFSAFVYKPMGLKDGEKIPMILSIHGGPETQELPVYMYNGLYQILLSMGIGVLAPNIRGSTGYGKKFQMMIHRNWHKITGDLEACAKYMQSLNWVDPERLGVYGGSFGGFATLWAVTQLPEYWKIGVDIVGPSNLVTFVSNVPSFWKPIMRSWIGDPVDDKEYLEKTSPINYVENINADMLILQGANDPRVVKSESDQIVEKLKAKGNYVEYKVYENEGHGWVREENRDDSRKRMLKFISKRFFDVELDVDADIF